MFSVIRNALLISSTLAIAACGSVPAPQGAAQYPSGADRDGPQANDIYAKPDSIFGDGGVFSMGKGNKDDNFSGQNGLGVNTYLWRASLDTVSFMPLASADPFGGVILTDWLTPEATPNERLKLNVFILDRQLRSSALQVKVFRQVRSGKGGEWRDADASPDTQRQLEDTILTRARQLRVADMGRDD